MKKRFAKIPVFVFGLTMFIVAFLPVSVFAMVKHEQGIEQQRADWGTPEACPITERGNVFNDGFRLSKREVVATCGDGKTYRVVMFQPDSTANDARVWTNSRTKSHYVSYDVTEYSNNGYGPALGTNWPWLQLPGLIVAVILAVIVGSIVDVWQYRFKESLQRTQPLATA